MTIAAQIANIYRFTGEVADFPPSMDTATTGYDTIKLIKILQEKEVLQACNITPEEFEQVNSIDLEFGKLTSDLLKETDLEASIEEYHRLERKIEEKVSGNLYLYAKQGAISVKALYYYKKKQYDKAIAITLECIALNEYLIDLGIGTLHLRCVEQNKNISRVLYRENKINEGHDLVKGILDYLFTGTSGCFRGHVDRYKKYWDKTPILREVYACDVFLMFVEDTIRFNLKEKNRLLPQQWYTGLDFEVNTPDRQFLYNWMYINKQLQEGHYEDYFDSITYYFQQPMSLYYDVLKISLLVDLARVIRLGEYPDKDQLLNSLKTCLNEKMFRHKSLRETVEKSFLL